MKVMVKLIDKGAGNVWREHGDARDTQHGYYRTYSVKTPNGEETTFTMVKANPFCNYWDAPYEWSLHADEPCNDYGEIPLTYKKDIDPGQLMSLRKGKWHTI